MNILTLEQNLNEAKDKLNIENYSILIRNTNYQKWVNSLKNELSTKYNAQNVTNAWLKCMEMLQDTDLKTALLSLNKNVFNVFCNAEFPGSFLFAINHYLNTNGKKMNWLISSYLSQNDENNLGLLQDSYSLRENYPQNVIVGEIIVTDKNGESNVHWNDGDLTNPHMPGILQELVVLNLGKVDLYTSDGGVDVSSDYNKQEISLISLKYGEAKTGILTLNEGGFMILKLFTFFTPFMKSLIYSLTDCFEKFKLLKPYTSSPINSEVYFIGMRFKNNSKFPKTDPSFDINNNWYTFNDDHIIKYIDDFLTSYITNQINIINHFLSNNDFMIDVTYPFPQKLHNKYELQSKKKLKK